MLGAQEVGFNNQGGKMMQVTVSEKEVLFDNQPIRLLTVKKARVVEGYELLNGKRSVAKQSIPEGTFECIRVDNPMNPDEEALYLYNFNPPVYIRVDFLDNIDFGFWELELLSD